MKKYLLLLSLCFIYLTNCFCQPLNFDFEKRSYSDETQPWSWFPATYGNAVKVSLDSTEKFEGKYSLKMEADETADIAQPYTYQFIIEPKYLIGHKIKFSGNIKTENLSDHANIMIAQYAGENFTLNDTASLNFQGTTAWKNFEINCSPVDSINNMSVEITLSGSGKIWVDNLLFYIDGKKTTEVLTVPLFSEKEKKALQKLCTAFSGVDAADDFSDLAFFKPLVKESAIIGLGESTHGTSEFFRLKHRMLHYAVQELGVRVFAIEDNMLAAELLNHYVLYGKGDPAGLINNLFGVWNNVEVFNMIKWIREYNLTHADSPVEFVGFDMQDIRLPLDSLYAFLNRYDEKLSEQVNEMLPDLGKNWWEIYALSPEEKLNWQNKANESFTLIETQKNNWLASAKNKKDSTNIYYGMQYANLVKQFARNNNVPYYTFYRDSAMASNILWQLNMRRPGTKIFVWAHDAHINKGSSPVAENNYYDGLSMGTYLNKWMGDKYSPFGLSTYAGTYRCVKSYSDFTWTEGYASESPAGSIDAALHEIAVMHKTPFLFLDLKPVISNTNKYSALLEARPIRMNNHVSIDYTYGDLVSVPYQFNGIFFIDKTTAAIE